MQETRLGGSQYIELGKKLIELYAKFDPKFNKDAPDPNAHFAPVNAAERARAQAGMPEGGGGAGRALAGLGGAERSGILPNAHYPKPPVGPGR